MKQVFYHSTISPARTPGLLRLSHVPPCYSPSLRGQANLSSAGEKAELVFVTVLAAAKGPWPSSLWVEPLGFNLRSPVPSLGSSE